MLNRSNLQSYRGGSAQLFPSMISEKPPYGYMLGFLFLCSSYAIITKYQDITTGKDGRHFQHPYW